MITLILIDVVSWNYFCMSLSFFCNLRLYVDFSRVIWTFPKSSSGPFETIWTFPKLSGPYDGKFVWGGCRSLDCVSVSILITVPRKRPMGPYQINNESTIVCVSGDTLNY